MKHSYSCSSKSRAISADCLKALSQSSDPLDQPLEGYSEAIAYLQLGRSKEAEVVTLGWQGAEAPSVEGWETTEDLTNVVMAEPCFTTLVFLSLHSSYPRSLNCE